MAAYDWMRVLVEKSTDAIEGYMAAHNWMEGLHASYWSATFGSVVNWLN